MNLITYWYNKLFKPIRIVMTIATRNEADILETNIEYHLSVGVDFFIITDNNSTDHTAEIIKKYEKQGFAKYILDTSDVFDQNKIVTQMAKMAHTTYGATWVINNDSDEFWWTDKKDLKRELKSVSVFVDAVHIKRSNFIPRLSTSNLFYEDMDIRETHSLNALDLPLPGKIIHRATPNIIVAFGNHDADAPEFFIKRLSKTIENFHFPIRNYKQFENKVITGGYITTHNKNLSNGILNTWKNLYNIFIEGGLPEYYKNKTLSDDSIRTGLSRNELTHDTRLKNHLKKLNKHF